MSASKKEPRTGTFLGVPYDWRRHGFKARLKERWWNPNEPRLFTPRAFGWGYVAYHGVHELVHSGGYAPYDALGYGCGTRAAPNATPLVEGGRLARIVLRGRSAVFVNEHQHKRSPGFGRGSGFVPLIAAHFGAIVTS
jgi:hypothetical protein